MHALQNMKKSLLFLVFVMLGLSAVQAEDTLKITAHENTQMVWHVNYDKKAYFPTQGKTFRKIYMYYTLGCAETGCSGWDYDVLTQIMHNTGRKDSTVQKLDTISQSPLVVDTTWRVFDVLEPYELGRLITPYGTYRYTATISSPHSMGKLNIAIYLVVVILIAKFTAIGRLIISVTCYQYFSLC